MSKYAYPVAAHSYFHATNKQAEYDIFKRSTHYVPSFSYRRNFNDALIAERLGEVSPTSKAHRNLRLVSTAIAFQSDPKVLADFRKQNVALYGAPRKEYVLAILCRLSKQVTPASRKLWKEALALMEVTDIPAGAFAPSDELFQTYRQYLRRYVKPFTSKDRSLAELIQSQLEVSGLISKGWKVEVRDDSIHALTNHRKKKIITGELYEPHTVRAKKRITIHEVYGHALRGQQNTRSEAEGVAIFLEQLMSTTFKYRRSYRYLAVALGYGVMGKPMNFRQVFDILWRLMVINSKYSPTKAKRHAFDECYRVFRGGRSDIAGAVLLKDAVYFGANIRVWKVLMKQEISYNEFVDIIEGRRTVLS